MKCDKCEKTIKKGDDYVEIVQRYKPIKYKCLSCITSNEKKLVITEDSKANEYFCSRNIGRFIGKKK